MRLEPRLKTHGYSHCSTALLLFFYLYANAGSARETWHGYRRHLLLHNDRISLRETWLAPFHSWGFSLQVLASSSPVILLFTHFDEPKNSLELANPTRNIRICSTKLMTITSGEINLQSIKAGYYLSRSESETCNFSALSGWRNTFFILRNIPIETNASIKQEKCILQ